MEGNIVFHPEDFGFVYRENDPMNIFVQEFFMEGLTTGNIVQFCSNKL